MKLSVGLFGFGRTGSIVAKEIIKDPDCELRWVIRKTKSPNKLWASRLLGFDHDEGQIFSFLEAGADGFFSDNKVDVIIDFSASGAVSEYMPAADLGTRIVSAISNYENSDFEKLENLKSKTAVLYSPNITLGINFLIEASKLLQKIAPEADIEIIEEHFNDKKDISGTAIRIADDLGLDREKHINSIRVGGIIGKHEVIFGLPNQTIRITHESLSKAAFGQGAIYAAKWIMSKGPGIYTMEEALSLTGKF
ncbi:MAG: dihydrodipicolinate reductase [Clostridia bacterium]|nr:dihydrodipicolinate reductase [Clostridia bacterium]